MPAALAAPASQAVRGRRPRGLLRRHQHARRLPRSEPRRAGRSRASTSRCGYRPAGRRRARDDDAAVAAPAGDARGAPLRLRRGARDGARRRARRHRHERSADAAPATWTRRPCRERAGAGLLAGLVLRDNLRYRKRHRARLPLRHRPGARGDHHRQRLLRARRGAAAGAAARRPSAACKVHAAAAGPLRVLHAALHQPADVRGAAAARASRSSSTSRASCMPRWRCSTAAGRVATVGSSNLDPISLLLAREANVFVRDDAFAAANCAAACCDAVQRDRRADRRLGAHEAAARGASEPCEWLAYGAHARWPCSRSGPDDI